MTRRLRIEWSPGSKVTALLAGPGEGKVGLLLAHGAGGGQRHPFMEGLRRRWGAAGFTTLTFDYPYMEADRRAPDRLDRLIECHAATFERVAERVDAVVVVGKSMGGRVGGHFVTETGAAAMAMVFLGYPLVPIGKAEPRDVSHLRSCRIPMLFVQGERDRMGPPEMIRQITEAALHATLEIVTHADHGFRVPKRTGLDREAILDSLALTTKAFVAGLG
ncbi:MAG: alpha/beta family hydrolase [Acidimicrobiia bacterium]